MWGNSFIRATTQKRFLSYSRRIQKQRRERFFQFLGAAVSGFVLWKAIGLIKKYAQAPQDQHEDRPKVVILGSGFASLGMVDTIDTNKFDVTVVSPRNYFLYTPLLAAATVGTVDLESIVEPIHSYAARHNAKITSYEAKCKDINVDQKKIICTVPGEPEFELNYDYLIVTTGAHNDTYDLPRVHEKCLFLSSLNDAVELRNHLVKSMESANIPSVSPEEKMRMLHFVIVGGSPIAREIAAQIHDYAYEKVNSVYPHLKDFVKISLISSNDHIHNYYDKRIHLFVEKQTKREDITVVKRKKVIDVSDKTLTLQTVNGERETMDYGTCIWSTGKIAQPLANTIAAKFSVVQTNSLALTVDPTLKLLGAQNIYAAGDCATIDQNKLLEKVERTFSKADVNKDGVIDLSEFKSLCSKLGKKYPALFEVSDRAEQIFQLHDKNKNDVLDMNEFHDAMRYINNKLTRFPSTASTAVQQGQYLGDFFNKGDYNKDLAEVTPFRYKHIGGYEYVGAEDGLVDRGSKGSAIMRGPGAWWMWKNAYYSSMVGLPMKLRISTNKLFSFLFGREPTPL